MGVSGETLAELKATLKFPFENNFDSVSFSMANAFKGSRLFEICVEKRFSIDPIDKVNYKRVNFIIPENHEFFIIPRNQLEKLVEDTSKRFYEWSASRFPEIYKLKYENFLKNSHETEEKIKGRI